MQSVEQRDEVEMLSLMLLIRRFEERAASSIKRRRSAVLYIGQEAVVPGVVCDDDYVTAYQITRMPARCTSADAYGGFLKRNRAVREAWAARCIS
jgi:hypothetical protein